MKFFCRCSPVYARCVYRRFLREDTSSDGRPTEGWRASSRPGSHLGAGLAPDPNNPDPNNPAFTVGQQGSYTPVLTGTPAPTVSVSSGLLPAGLQLDSSNGVISGTPAAGTAGTYNITLAAHNGISPDATRPVMLTVNAES